MSNKHTIIDNLCPADKAVWRRYLEACAAERSAETAVIEAQRTLMIARRRTSIANKEFLETEGGRAWDTQLHVNYESALILRRGAAVE